jgi:hypothetical protein
MNPAPALSDALPAANAKLATNENAPLFDPKKQKSMLNVFYDVKDSVRSTGQAINTVNPMHYAYQATEMLNQKTHVSGIVGYINVIHFVFFLLSCIFWALSWLCNILIGVIIAAIAAIIGFLFSLIPFIPIFIVIFLVGLVCQKLWDVVLTPIIEGLVTAYNGVIHQWNIVTDALRYIGFHVPMGRILGHDLGFDIGFKFLDLPHGTEASVNLVTFRKFILDILFFLIVKPFLRSTNGYIFRDNVADISVDEFNNAMG